MNQDIKIMLFGDPGVGKSSILIQYLENYFEDDYYETSSFKYNKKCIILCNKLKVTLHIWDTSGKIKYDFYKKSEFYKINYFVVCFDLSNVNSLNNLSDWFNIINEIGNNKKILLVGNKLYNCNIDSGYINRMISSYVSMYNIFRYIEINAINYNDVYSVFQCICNNICNTICGNNKMLTHVQFTSLYERLEYDNNTPTISPTISPTLKS